MSLYTTDYANTSQHGNIEPPTLQGRVIIVEGPSPSGKTAYLKAAVKAFSWGTACYYSSEEAYELLLQVSKKFPQGKIDDAKIEFSRRLGGSDGLVAIDDVDVFLRGRQQTQIIFGESVNLLRARGVDIMIAGIELVQRAPHFRRIVSTPPSEYIELSSAK